MISINLICQLVKSIFYTHWLGSTLLLHFQIEFAKPSLILKKISMWYVVIKEIFYLLFCGYFWLFVAIFECYSIYSFAVFLSYCVSFYFQEWQKHDQGVVCRCFLAPAVVAGQNKKNNKKQHKIFFDKTKSQPSAFAVACAMFNSSGHCIVVAIKI